METCSIVKGINNLQSTFSGFGVVESEKVFQVCDQPHPLLVKTILNVCSGEVKININSKHQHIAIDDTI